MRRELLRALLALAASLALAAELAAHVVEPQVPILLRPGGEDFVYCFEPPGGSCKADISITSNAPGKIEVYAINMTTKLKVPGNGVTASVAKRKDQAFIVAAAAGVKLPVSSSVTVCWNGVLPCTDVKCPGAIVPVTISDLPATSGATSSAGIARDPVNLLTGELWWLELADLFLNGPMALAFERYYASRIVEEGNVASTLGPNWLHNFSWKLEFVGFNVEIVTPRGRVIRFETDFFDGGWTLTPVKDVPYQLNQNANNWKLGDPLSGMIYTFDPNGFLTKIEDGRGNALSLTYAGVNLASVSDGLGRTLTFTYTSGRLTGVSDGTRNVDFGYDGNGRLASATDADGNVTTYAYDAAQPAYALLTALTRPEGNVPYSQTWGPKRRVTSQTDALGNTYEFTYGATSTVEDPELTTQVFDHGAGQALEGLTDEAGFTATLGNNAKGQRVSVTDRLGDVTSWKYHAASGLIASETEADGSKTDYSYAKRTKSGLDFFDTSAIFLPDGSHEMFGRDANGNPTSIMDRAGKTWLYTFDSRGQVLTETNPRGAVTSYAYNPDGTLNTITDQSGNTTTLSYDSFKRPSSALFADGSTVSLTYDALDQVLSFEDEMARTTSFTYDANGNLLTVTTPSGEVTTYGYDSMDRANSVTDPAGDTTSIAFDARDHVESITNGAGETTTFGYNSRGWLNAITDGLSNTTGATFDREHILTSLSDSLGNKRTFVSDSRGRITKTTSPRGRVVKITYDSLGRVTKVVDPKGQATNLAYDAHDGVSQVSMPIANGTASATRNSLGQVNKITYPGGSAWQYGYDTEGRLTSITDPLARSIGATFDQRDRVETLTLPGGMGTIDCTWNVAGQLTDLDASDGGSLHYAYDADGNLIDADGATFVWDDGRIVDSNGIAIGHDGVGRVDSLTFAPGKVVTYTYDAGGLLATIADWLGGVVTYTYDAAGNVTAIARPNGITTRYTYDEDSRLVQIVEELDTLVSTITNISTIDVTYDKNNLIKSIVNTPPLTGIPALGVTTRTFDAAGQLNGATFDPLGQLLTNGTTTNTWNHFGQLTSTTEGATPTTYGWNGFGDLISTQTGADSTEYTLNYGVFTSEFTSVPSIRSKSGVDELFFVHDLNSPAPVFQVNAVTDQRVFFHYDPFGSTRLLSNDAGTITDGYEEDPVGNVLSSFGNTVNEFRFRATSGAIYDSSSGLTFLGSRPFDPRFELYICPSSARALDPRAGNPYLINLGNPQQRLYVSSTQANGVNPRQRLFAGLSGNDRSSVFPGKAPRSQLCPVGYLPVNDSRFAAWAPNPCGGQSNTSSAAANRWGDYSSSTFTDSWQGPPRGHGFSGGIHFPGIEEAQETDPESTSTDAPLASLFGDPSKSYREIVNKLRKHWKREYKRRKQTCGSSSSGGRGTTVINWKFGDGAARFTRPGAPIRLPKCTSPEAPTPRSGSDAPRVEIFGGYGYLPGDGFDAVQFDDSCHPFERFGGPRRPLLRIGDL